MFVNVTVSDHRERNKVSFTLDQKALIGIESTLDILRQISPVELVRQPRS